MRLIAGILIVVIVGGLLGVAWLGESIDPMPVPVDPAARRRGLQEAHLEVLLADVRRLQEGLDIEVYLRTTGDLDRIVQQVVANRRTFEWLNASVTSAALRSDWDRDLVERLRVEVLDPLAKLSARFDRGPSSIRWEAVRSKVLARLGDSAREGYAYSLDRATLRLSVTSSASAKEEFARLLSQSELTTVLDVTTKKSGAIVKYRLFGDKNATTMKKPTNKAKATIAIGIYQIWTERDGRETSSKDEYVVVEKTDEVEIVERK